MDKPEFVYEITSAFLQVGSAPPYTLVRLQTRMDGDTPQVLFREWDLDADCEIECWYDFPQNERRVIRTTDDYGRPIAGITSDWRLRRE